MVPPICSPVSAFHIFAVLSHDAVTIYFPSLLNAAELTMLSCFMVFPICSPVFAFHIFAVLSNDAVTIYFPSLLNAAERTSLSCFIVFPTCSPVFAFHIFAVLSNDAVTMYFPFGLNETELISASCFNKYNGNPIDSLAFLNVNSATSIYGLSGFSIFLGSTFSNSLMAFVSSFNTINPSAFSAIKRLCILYILLRSLTMERYCIKNAAPIATITAIIAIAVNRCLLSAAACCCSLRSVLLESIWRARVSWIISTRGSSLPGRVT